MNASTQQFVPRDSSVRIFRRKSERTELVFDVESDPAIMPPLIKYLTRRAARIAALTADDRHALSMSLHESLTNAIYHGNLELSSDELGRDESHPEGSGADLVSRRRKESPSCHRRIYVSAQLSVQVITITVRDEGRGFDLAAVPDPTSPEGLSRASGRGLLLMRHFLDEVRFNSIGNEVTLIKRCRPLKN